MRWFITLFMLISVCALTACSGSGRRVGIPNRWRSPDIQFTTNKTTEEDVLRILGPPSQIVAIHQRTVYFYVLEETSSLRLGLLIFAWSSFDVEYDRAIFFFDKNGRLEKYALSPKSLVYEDD
ncbi:MAG: hypothetical protein QF752_13255 [Planctomycetota bacterium]|jgi:hypothetical protein|nr:hypothetical protein [Planctomycetota bacterium]